MIDNLPEELKLRIFHKLPMKTLGKCICVSKSWLSLIKNPNFISSTTTTTTNNHLIFFQTCSDQFSFHFDNDEFDQYMLLDLPFKADTRDSGTCNGLICLIKDYYWPSVEDSIVLWNPIIKKTLTVPKPNITLSVEEMQEVFYGFGFDSSTNDYKLVRILHHFRKVEVPEPQAEIFSLNRNCWTNVTQFVPKYKIVRNGMQAFVNGVLHWIGYGRGRNGNLYWCRLVGLDMGSEEFREIMLPESMDCWFPNHITISVYKESSIGVCFHDFMNEYLEVWVMKEYGDVESWTKIWRLDWDDTRQLPMTLGFRSNGEVFLEVYRESTTTIISMDDGNEQQKDVGIRKSGLFHFGPVSYFVESLVFLDNPNAVSYANVATNANFSSDATEGSGANRGDIDAVMQVIHSLYRSNLGGAEQD